MRMRRGRRMVCAIIWGKVTSLGVLELSGFPVVDQHNHWTSVLIKTLVASEILSQIPFAMSHLLIICHPMLEVGTVTAHANLRDRVVPVSDEIRHNGSASLALNSVPLILSLLQAVL